MNPVPNRPITTPYGVRGKHWSCNKDSAGNGMHTGMDIAAPVGTPIVAARSGEARRVNFGSAFGSRQLEIIADDGSTDFYAHMSALLALNGEQVKAGQVIGHVGQEGNATGPHLHFERHKIPGRWNCDNHTDPRPSFDWQPPPEDVTVRVAHISMQFSDNKAQVTQDLFDIFRRAEKYDWWWITGTEAGGAKSEVGPLLRKIGPKFGFTIYQPKNTDGWIAVNTRHVSSGGVVRGEFTKVLDGEAGKFTNRGVVEAGFPTELGKITVLTSHYLTKGTPVGDKTRLPQNRQIAAKIGEIGERAGRLGKLVFYGGDQNISDRKADTFLGQPFTSIQDELGKHYNTGHGPIDVIASYDADRRVRAHSVRVDNDREFSLHTDHFLVVGTFRVRPLR